ncbi:hypothetical protein LSS_20875 [Leptospira santarosai serovar Shermani str. LT 821]|uniref:Uncharacterized protein n=1 Tax=Leptospira santarosai serovar Shermani str. LT 821 TaxID=758847 RepID=A0A097ESA2_9LEPT|nr:hypothetical protein LSS_20875 [Leptospira santarosai serovar Shermani str. LT 821]
MSFVIANKEINSKSPGSSGFFARSEILSF